MSVFNITTPLILQHPTPKVHFTVHRMLSSRLNSVDLIKRKTHQPAKPWVPDTPDNVTSLKDIYLK